MPISNKIKGKLNDNLNRPDMVTKKKLDTQDKKSGAVNAGLAVLFKCWCGD